MISYCSCHCLGVDNTSSDVLIKVCHWSDWFQFVTNWCFQPVKALLLWMCRTVSDAEPSLCELQIKHEYSHHWWQMFVRHWGSPSQSARRLFVVRLCQKHWKCSLWMSYCKKWAGRWRDTEHDVRTVQRWRRQIITGDEERCDSWTRICWRRCRAGTGGTQSAANLTEGGHVPQTATRGSSTCHCWCVQGLESPQDFLVSEPWAHMYIYT